MSELLTIILGIGTLVVGFAIILATIIITRGKWPDED